MQANYNYPWYIQKTPSFTKLYDALFDIASMATPLGAEDLMFPDKATGEALFRLGILWGLTGAPKYYDGLIYAVDNWSDTKTWSGQLKDVEGKLYKQFIKLHAFCNGRQFNLQLIKDAIAFLMEGKSYKLTVDEGFMSFTINIEGDASDLRILQEMQSYDRRFLGQPSGIQYSFNYITTGA